jgi:4-aminobutyrate aminotransferase/(S)-3-amino-2-methylpropionate transaminase
VGAIKLNTEIPGPKSRAIVARKDATVSDSYDLHTQAVIQEGHGSTFTDVDGNVFLDFGTGVGPNIIGHSHPRVVEAVVDQARRFSHTDFAVVPYESFVELSERIIRMMGGGDMRVALFNSGAEAVENAIKIAKAGTGRHGVLTFDRAFHGRTLLAMSLTSKNDPYKKGFGPFAPEVYRMPFPYPYHSADPATAGAEALAAIEQAFITTVDPETVAAAIIEPIQGEGGFVVPTPDFLSGLKELCGKHGILLITDEVQSGTGRTGRFLASEHFGVVGDLVILAKGLGSGYPISAVVGSPELMNLGSSRLGGTYVGNPVACAAACATLAVIEEEGLMERAADIERTVTKFWEDASSDFPEIGDIRGIGAMMAVEFVTDPATKEPNVDLVNAILAEANQRGLIVLKCGIMGNVIRHLVPLTISDPELEEGLEILVDCARTLR